VIRTLGLPEVAPVVTSRAAGATPSSATQFFRQLARAVEGTTGQRTSLGARFGATDDATIGSQANAVRPFGADGRPASALRELIAAAARQENVSPSLLSAIVEVESGFNPHAVSPAGAKGLTQLMDGTARRLGVTDSFDPWQSLVGGARFLRGLLGRYSGNLPLALAAYNAGPAAVEAAGSQVPPFPETQRYVHRVLAVYSRNNQNDRLPGEPPTSD